MPFLTSLPDDAGVRHILRTNPQLTAADKELIAAYVSGLNACQYCYGVHSETAKAFGMPQSLIDALLTDLETAPVSPRLKPVLAYARLLTLTPTRATQGHVDAILAEGWTERDLHDAILTVCLFNFMNRLLEGHGVKGSPALFEERGQALHDDGYAPMLAMLADPKA